MHGRYATRVLAGEGFRAGTKEGAENVLPNQATPGDGDIAKNLLAKGRALASTSTSSRARERRLFRRQPEKHQNLLGQNIMTIFPPSPVRSIQSMAEGARKVGREADIDDAAAHRNNHAEIRMDGVARNGSSMQRPQRVSSCTYLLALWAATKSHERVTWRPLPL